MLSVASSHKSRIVLHYERRAGQDPRREVTLPAPNAHVAIIFHAFVDKRGVIYSFNAKCDDDLDSVKFFDAWEPEFRLLSVDGNVWLHVVKHPVNCKIVLVDYCSK